MSKLLIFPFRSSRIDIRAKSVPFMPDRERGRRLIFESSATFEMEFFLSGVCYKQNAPIKLITIHNLSQWILKLIYVCLFTLALLLRHEIDGILSWKIEILIERMDQSAHNPIVYFIDFSSTPIWFLLENKTKVTKNWEIDLIDWKREFVVFFWSSALLVHICLFWLEKFKNLKQRAKIEQQIRIFHHNIRR